MKSNLFEILIAKKLAYLLPILSWHIISTLESIQTYLETVHQETSIFNLQTHIWNNSIYVFREVYFGWNLYMFLNLKP